jgi:protein phosphatase
VGTIALVRAIAAGLTDTGRERSHNEDRFMLLPEFNVYVVADGMGGHQSGEVAARMAASTIAGYFRTTSELGAPGSVNPDDIETPTFGTRTLPTPEAPPEATPGAPPEDPDDVAPMSKAPHPAPASMRDRLRAALTIANGKIHARADDSRAHRGMGTTIVAAGWSSPDRCLYVAHAGDSRCYLIRGADMKQLTRDHSLLQDALLERPELTENDLAYLPRNVITRALGIAATVDIDVASVEAALGDVFLLCTDGLHGLVDDRQILAIVRGTSSLSDACARLIATANENGGKDNITAVLIRIEEEDEPWSSRAPVPPSNPVPAEGS